MKLQLLFFGLVTDILGVTSAKIEVIKDCSVQELKAQLLLNYPQLKNIDSYVFAINEEYADDTTVLKENDVVAIIPPVSGG